MNGEREARSTRDVRYSPTFLRHLHNLPQRIIDAADERERIFRANCFHPILRTHKLHGEERETWAFWVTYRYRIKFIFLGESEVLFLDIGTHEIYQ